jgi:hypothetical protein
MQEIQYVSPERWQLWRKLAFRFFFVYFILYLSPWDWLSIIPGVDYILGFYNDLFEWAVIKTNASFFHVFNVKNVKPVSNGSGDTSFNWASNLFLLWVAFIGCIIWSVTDRKRRSYIQLNYLLCLFMRYSISLIAFSYGFQKLFALQMPFPMLSQLATPLGDFLPMRFSWLFIGYSAPYEIFSGFIEVMVGVLLLFRKTTTLGVLLATAVFINIMMLNLSYDIPVKLYSMNIVLMCLYLLANEFDRIACFFVLNKPARLCSIYHYPLTKKWMRITRIVLKLAIIFLIGKLFSDTVKGYKQYGNLPETKPIKSGVYDVTTFIVNKDTIAPLITDSLRWKDVIFEKGGMGSIHTVDTIFRKRYGRGYFIFTTDTVNNIINFKKFMQDRQPILSLHYLMPDSNTILLSGKKREDSLFITLKRSNRHFQLAEKQFHWLSEANR